MEYYENQNYNRNMSRSFNFFDFIQCIVVCRYICIINFVESNHNWVAGFGVLSNIISTVNNYTKLNVKHLKEGKRD